MPRKTGAVLAVAISTSNSSETSNNAAVEGSLVPLLTLGIPGAPQAAALSGALLLHSLRPGPELFSGNGAVITYTFIFSLFIANAMMFIIGIGLASMLAPSIFPSICSCLLSWHFQ